MSLHPPTLTSLMNNPSCRTCDGSLSCVPRGVWKFIERPTILLSSANSMEANHRRVTCMRSRCYAVPYVCVCVCLIPIYVEQVTVTCGTQSPDYSMSYCTITYWSHCAYITLKSWPSYQMEVIGRLYALTVFKQVEIASGSHCVGRRAGLWMWWLERKPQRLSGIEIHSSNLWIVVFSRHGA